MRPDLLASSPSGCTQESCTQYNVPHTPLDVFRARRCARTAPRCEGPWAREQGLALGGLGPNTEESVLRKERRRARGCGKRRRLTTPAGAAARRVRAQRSAGDRFDPKNGRSRLHRERGGAAARAGHGGDRWRRQRTRRLAEGPGLHHDRRAAGFSGRRARTLAGKPGGGAARARGGPGVAERRRELDGAGQCERARVGRAPARARGGVRHAARETASDGEQSRGEALHGGAARAAQRHGTRRRGCVALRRPQKPPRRAPPPRPRAHTRRAPVCSPSNTADSGADGEGGGGGAAGRAGARAGRAPQRAREHRGRAARQA